MSHSMIELAFDQKDMDEALARLGGAKDKLDRIIRDIVPGVAQRVREEVLEHLGQTVALAPRKGALVKRAVRALKHRGESSFVVASRRLLLGDYDVDPMSVTAQPGVPVKMRSPFNYSLRHGGRRFSSLTAPTAGSIPFIARTKDGRLRVMFRGSNDSLQFLHAPSIQYHAATPEVDERIQDLGAELFRSRLNAALERMEA